MTVSAGDIPVRVFISYRREEASLPAALLFDRLVGHLGRDKVFKDVDSTALGGDLAEAITATVGASEVLLALIGARWLTITDLNGRRCLDNPDDSVRLEIEAALARNVRVLPILVDGARMPGAVELPASLAELARQQALELSPSRFDADLRRLLPVLDRTIAEVRERGRQEAGRAANPPIPLPPAGLSPAAAAERGRDDDTPLQAAIRIARGIISATGLIAGTLGPKDRKCLMRDESGASIETSDAGTIAENLVPEDPQEALGASYVRDMVRERRYAVHDGAATAAVLARAMVARAMKAWHDGASPISLIRGMETAVNQVNKKLSTLVTEVETVEQVAWAAATSAGDTAIGEVIAKAFDLVGAKGMTTVEAFDYLGREGAILVKEGGSFRLELRVKEGMSFGEGYISPYFVTDQEHMQADLDDAYILIVDYKLSASMDVLPLLRNAPRLGKPVAIIAWGVEGEALASLIDGKARGVLTSVAVRAPGSDDRRVLVEDIAVLTGAQVISSQADLELAITNGLDILGRARKVVVTKDETTIVDGGGDAAQIMVRLHQIEAEMDCAGSDHDRKKLHERTAGLAGGRVVITVRAATGTERQELKQRAESAIWTAREAIASGMLPGGGAALMDVQRSLASSPGPLPADEAAGAAIVLDSLAEPLMQIAANAGHTDPAALADSIRSSKSGTGFDIITNSCRGMRAAGIVDSFSATSRAITDAADLTKRLLLPMPGAADQ